MIAGPDLWAGSLDGDAKFWNTALTAIWHILATGIFSPMFYAGVGQNSWKYTLRRVSRLEYEDSGRDSYWHVGVAVQTDLSPRMAGWVGYRYWRSNMEPAPGLWVANIDDYYYERGGLEVALRLRF